VLFFVGRYERSEARQSLGDQDGVTVMLSLVLSLVLLMLMLLLSFTSFRSTYIDPFDSLFPFDLLFFVGRYERSEARQSLGDQDGVTVMLSLMLLFFSTLCVLCGE